MKDFVECFKKYDLDINENSEGDYTELILMLSKKFNKLELAALVLKYYASSKIKQETINGIKDMIKHGVWE